MYSAFGFIANTFRANGALERFTPFPVEEGFYAGPVMNKPTTKTLNAVPVNATEYQNLKTLSTTLTYGNNKPLPVTCTVKRPATATRPPAPRAPIR